MPEINEQAYGTFYSEMLKDTFVSAEEREHYEGRHAMRLQAIESENNPLNKLSADELLQAWQMAERTELQRANDLRNGSAAEAFAQNHPEYVPNQHNGNALELLLSERGFGTNQVASVQDIEKAYNDLRSRGLLQVDDTKVVEEKPVPQEPAASTSRRSGSGMSARRGAPKPDLTPDPEEASRNMTTEELRAAALGELLGHQVHRASW